MNHPFSPLSIDAKLNKKLFVGFASARKDLHKKFT
jgi:hypothetical protein